MPERYGDRYIEHSISVELYAKAVHTQRPGHTKGVLCGQFESSVYTFEMSANVCRSDKRYCFFLSPFWLTSRDKAKSIFAKGWLVGFYKTGLTAITCDAQEHISHALKNFVFALCEKKGAGQNRYTARLISDIDRTIPLLIASP